MLTQDKNGIVWIGTLGGGLDRFDPTTEKFTHFKNNPNNKNSLANDFVWMIFKSSEEGLLGLNEGGLNKPLFPFTTQ